MIKINIELPDGRKSEYIHVDGMSFRIGILNVIPNKDLKEHANNIRNLEIRDDDVYLATYMKSGTHWVWEILTMLKRGTAEYETNPKISAMLDFQSPEAIQALPSPRVLNCHFPFKLVPEEVFRKKTKIVHVMRNPKDVIVSFYHHHKNAEFGKDDLDTYISRMVGEFGVYHFYPWFKYVKEWERFSKQHPDQILNLFYEDLKEDPVREIKKINMFLGTERSDDLVMKIADACDFENLKRADSELKQHEDRFKTSTNLSALYRKGQVGDWKNHFTVAQNEKVDKWLEENLVDTDLKFRYNL